MVPRCDGICVIGVGKEAIEILKAKQGTNDLIMSEFDGAATFDLFRVANPEIPVALSSGYSLDGQAQEVLNRGCDGFIPKPFNLPELSQVIREVLVSRRNGLTLTLSLLPSFKFTVG